MPFIPNYEAVSGIHSPSTVSPDAASAPGRGLANLGQGISRLGDAVGDIQQRRQRLNDERVLNEGQLTIQRVGNDSIAHHQENPDTDTWESDFTGRIDEARSVFAKEKLSPAARLKLDQLFEGAKQDGLQRTRAAAFRETSRRTRQSRTDTMRAYIDAGDFTSARRVAADTTAFASTEVDADFDYIGREETAWQQKQSAARYDIQALESPGTVIDCLTKSDDHGNFLNEPAMKDATRNAILQRATRQREKLRDDDFRQLRSGIEMGGITDEADIDRLGTSLKDIDRQSLKAFMHRSAPPTMEDHLAAFDRIMKIRDDYGSAMQGTLEPTAYMQRFSDARSVITSRVPPGYAGPLLDMLGHYSPEKVIDQDFRKRAPSPEDLMKDIQVETEARLNAAYRQHYFGRTDRQAATPIEGDDARRKLNDLRTVITDKLRAEKDLTLLKARQIVDLHIAPLKLRQAADILQKSIPGSGQRLRPGGETGSNNYTPARPLAPEEMEKRVFEEE